MKYIVIGIEGTVASGKSSICNELIELIPNSIILDGSAIYRGITYAILNSGLDLEGLKTSYTNVNIREIMKKLKITFEIEDKKTVIYMNGQKIDDEKLQSESVSKGVSTALKVADNEALYEFARGIINSLKDRYNVIVYAKDLMKIYPDLDYHFLITASIEERINRRYNQYNGSISKEEIRKTIEYRDKIQEESGLYHIYDKTIQIDVTKCKDAHESAKKVLENIKL